jgi:heterodisulfide reductase subunit D
LNTIFNKINKKIKVVDKGELCCGSVLYTTGQGKRGNKNRTVTEHVLKRNNITEMVLLCPGCLRTFSEYYIPRKSNPLKKVDHYTRILTDNLDSIEFKTPRRKKLKVAYHDPCHLGRHMGITEEPRTLLQTIPGVEFVELPQARAESFCCGSGGGLRAYNKDLADHSSSLRLQEAKSIEADHLITSCPFCERSFLAAQESDRNVRDIKVQNLAVFLEAFIIE